METTRKEHLPFKEHEEEEEEAKEDFLALNNGNFLPMSICIVVVVAFAAIESVSMIEKSRLFVCLFVFANWCCLAGPFAWYYCCATSNQQPTTSYSTNDNQRQQARLFATTCFRSSAKYTREKIREKSHLKQWPRAFMFSFGQLHENNC